MTKCPKCGGTNGYEGVLVIRYVMGGVWGEDWETTGDETTLYKSATLKCTDCGRCVDRIEATTSHTDERARATTRDE